MTALNSPERVQRINALSADSSALILEYYRETIEDYQLWSPHGYMHFGKWERGLNPLNRQVMLERMNDFLFERLQSRRQSLCGSATLDVV